MTARLAAFVLGASLCGGCGDGASGPHALFTLHPPAGPIDQPTADVDFYSLPFPNDLRLRADGTIDLSSYPHSVGTVADYISAFDKDPAGGFATQGGIFFRFDAPLDPASLPDPAGSLAADAAVYVVDIGAGSPTYDQRTPVQARFTADAYDFIGPNWLALLPVPGIPLREHTTYAAVITDRVRGRGGAVRASADFVAARSGAAGAPYAPLVAWLAAHPALASHVVDAAVFTTRPATAVMSALRAAVYAQAPAPTFDQLRSDGPLGSVATLYEGTYRAPIFQSGDAPYFGSGGNIVRDATGAPIVQSITPLRVAITIPTGPAPAAGWPVVLYQHGTGGDYMSFVRDGSAAAAARVTDAHGLVVAQMAMLSIDAVENGARVPAGTDNDLAFFNFLNLAAVHDNVLQGAADGFQMVRLVHAAGAGAQLPFVLDATRILFKGHSQGGLVGPLFLAAEPEVRAAVLSGAGGDLIYTLLNKTEPNDIPKLVQSFFHDPADAFHPVLSLVQGFFEDADPANYGRLLFADPLPGVAPKSIFQSLGVVDHYTPIPNIEALALAMGVQPIGTQLVPVDHLQLTKISWGTAPVAGNVSGGVATGVLLQYPAAPGSDGHFVVFDDSDAVAQSNRFLASALSGQAARLDPP